uniref:Putative homing endonuclease n=1 Tax=viral metagenome TaxID=1070528 RepID=A0A6M3LKP8_9ZZZZ
MSKRKRLCKCGCGQEIKYKPYYKYYGIPRFISGHNARLMTRQMKKKFALLRIGIHCSEATKEKIRNKLLKQVILTCVECDKKFSVSLSSSKTRKFHNRKCYLIYHHREGLSDNAIQKMIETKRKNPLLFSKETRKKIGNSKEGKTYEEIYGDRAGEERKKRRESHRKRWIGKKKCEERPYQGCDWKYNEWRKKVFKKNSYICQKCKQNSDTLQAHHIKNFSSEKKLRHKISNGITFCEKCHKLFHKKHGQRNNTLNQILEFIKLRS